MATNQKASAYFIFICLIFNVVLSLPAPAEVVTSVSTTGIKATTDAAATAANAATAAVNAATNTAAKVTEAVGSATTAATTAANAATAAANAATTTAGKLTESANSEVTSAIQLGTNAAKTGAGLVGGKFSTGRGQLASTLNLLQAQNELTSAIRKVAGEVIDGTDQGTGYLSGGIGAAANGAGGLIDGGLKVLGIQTPIGTAAANTMWRMGEAGRSSAIALLRQGVDGTFYLLDPSVITQPFGTALANIRLTGNGVSRPTIPSTSGSTTVFSATT